VQTRSIAPLRADHVRAPALTRAPVQHERSHSPQRRYGPGADDRCPTPVLAGLSGVKERRAFASRFQSLFATSAWTAGSRRCPRCRHTRPRREMGSPPPKRASRRLTACLRLRWGRGVGMSWHRAQRTQRPRLASAYLKGCHSLLACAWRKASGLSCGGGVEHPNLEHRHSLPYPLVDWRGWPRSSQKTSGRDDCVQIRAALYTSAHVRPSKVRQAAVAAVCIPGRRQ